MKEERNSDMRRFEHQMAAVFLVVVGLLLMLCSCSPRIVERVEYRHDTTYVSRVDSLWVLEKDSVFVREKGDTVYKYVERIRYRDRVKVDTVLRVSIDSVAVERTKEVQVEKPISAWKRAKLGAFWYLLAGVVVLLAWTFRKTLLKLF